jgi:hypothetical protein
MTAGEKELHALKRGLDEVEFRIEEANQNFNDAWITIFRFAPEV